VRVDFLSAPQPSRKTEFFNTIGRKCEFGRRPLSCQHCYRLLGAMDQDHTCRYKAKPLGLYAKLGAYQKLIPNTVHAFTPKSVSSQKPGLELLRYNYW